MKKKLPLLIIIIACLLILPNLSLAASSDNIIFSNPVPGLGGPTGDVSVPQTLGIITQRILGLIGVIALLFFIYAGFMWMTAQGASEKIQQAQKIMLWAGIGLIIIFASYILLHFVFKIFPPANLPEGSPLL